MAKKKNTPTPPPLQETGPIAATNRRRPKTVTEANDRSPASGTTVTTSEEVGVASGNTDTTTLRADMRSGTAFTHDDIAAAAYQRYLDRGGSHGRDLDDWVEAERELNNRRR